MTEITYKKSIQLHYSGLEKDSFKLVLSQTYVTIFENVNIKPKLMNLGPNLATKLVIG